MSSCGAIFGRPSFTLHVARYGFKSACLHGDMTQPDRDRVMQKFMKSVGRGVELGEDDGEEVPPK